MGNSLLSLLLLASSPSLEQCRDRGSSSCGAACNSSGQSSNKGDLITVGPKRAFLNNSRANHFEAHALGSRFAKLHGITEGTVKRLKDEIFGSPNVVNLGANNRNYYVEQTPSQHIETECSQGTDF